MSSRTHTTHSLHAIEFVANAFQNSLVPVAVGAVGTITVFLQPPNASVRSAMQHFAAGVVFAVVGVELLPDTRKQHRPVQVVIGFAIGIAIMLLLRFYTGKGEDDKEGNKQELPLSLLVATGRN